MSDTPILTGEIVPDEPQDDDRYTVSANLRKMTWGDQMIQARFQLLISTVEGDDDADPKAKVAALKEIIAGFDELTEYLERVATVTCNGVRIPFRRVPMDMVSEVMDAISKAQKRQGNSKN